MCKEFDSTLDVVAIQTEVQTTQEIKNLDDLSLAYVGGGEALVNL